MKFAGCAIDMRTMNELGNTLFPTLIETRLESMQKKNIVRYIQFGRLFRSKSIDIDLLEQVGAMKFDWNIYYICWSWKSKYFAYFSKGSRGFSSIWLSSLKFKPVKPTCTYLLSLCWIALFGKMSINLLSCFSINIVNSFEFIFSIDFWLRLWFI